MDTNNNSFTWTSSSDSPSLSNVNLSLSFQFWFILSCQIPSVACYLYVLTAIISQKSQRQALHNHPILVLLIISLCIVLFDYSWDIDSYRHDGNVLLHSSFFCQVWWLLDFGFYNAGTVVLAWASFERYILIFHKNFLATKRRVILIHYLPLLSILVYMSIFYIYVIFFPPCENEYDFTLSVCGAYPCYFTVPMLIMWDLILHGVVATFSIAILNICLLGRLLWQKRHQHRSWRKCRKMVLQLLSISALYMSMNLPLMIIAVVQVAGYPDWGVQPQTYLYFFCGLIQYLLPFNCMTFLPNKWSKLKVFLMREHRRIVPSKRRDGAGGQQSKT